MGARVRGKVYQREEVRDRVLSKKLRERGKEKESYRVNRRNIFHII